MPRQTVDATAKELWIINKLLDHYKYRQTATPSRLVAEVLSELKHYRTYQGPCNYAYILNEITPLLKQITEEIEKL